MIKRLTRLPHAAKSALARRVAWRYGNAELEMSKRREIARVTISELRSFTEKNSYIAYSVQAVGTAEMSSRYNWTGAQYYEGMAYFVPNGAATLVAWDGDDGLCKWAIEHIDNEPFKWTGGCIFQDKLFCFPRASNELLICDLGQESLRKVDLGQGYRGEHHYGGVMTARGMVYQPPRNTDHILSIDLASSSLHAKKIPLAPPFVGAKLRYCGSFLHPNGLVYFLPERDERVLVFDPETEQFKRIGPPIDAMVFDVALAPDGNLYGFSAAGYGLLQIDIKRESVEMLKTGIDQPGCYGTKLGLNGRLYGVAGKGGCFLEYDPTTREAKVIGKGLNEGVVTCAGATVTQHGMIVCAPCQEGTVYALRPSESCVIPKQLFVDCFSDCY